MILDSLKNSDNYNHIHPLFKEAFDFLKSSDFLKMETGKIELKGKDLFVLLSDSDMKSQENTKLEVHNKYIDIQLPVSKSETFGWKSRSEIKNEREAFNEEKDIQFFTDSYTTLLNVSPNNFIVFFPEDGHAPCIGEGNIRKVVMKIKV